MTFYTSLSGLQAAQADMSVISHNVANVATNGFKKSRTDFADVMASSQTASPKLQVGLGVVVQGTRQEFATGNITATGNTLDMAISGDGFFAVKPSASGAQVNYTRNGGFQANDDNYVVDGSGSFLQVYPADGSGNIVGNTAASMKSLQIPETSGIPAATTKVSLGVNLNSATALPATTAFSRFDPTSYNQSTQTTVYDAKGNAQTMVNYYKRESAPVATAAGAAPDLSSTWSVYSYVGDQQMTSGGANKVSLTFDATGKLTSPSGAQNFDAFTPVGSGTQQQIALDLSTGTTQATAPFKVATQTQDGVAIGQFENLAIDDKGIVKATFTNGDVQVLGQVALANFSDPTGLRQIGDNYWSATGSSGAPEMGSGDSAGLGAIKSSSIEHSNVDTTEELVNLIAAQRNFQANSKALDTQSQILQTIFQIQS